MIKLKMKNYNAILTEKQQKYHHYRQVKLININILQMKQMSDQSRITEHAKFTYSPLDRVFEKQIKTIEKQGKKQVEAIEVLKPEENLELETNEGIFPKKIKNNKIKNELDKIKKWEEKLSEKTRYIGQININLIFNNMKLYLLVKVFIVVKLL